jgi:hypothetical protein
MWERIRAGSGLLKIRPQEEADLDPGLVDRMTAHARRLLSEGKLHSDTDVTIAVDNLQPNTTETVDAFIVVASHIAHSFGPNNLLAVISLRKWADRNRGPIMVSC